MFTLWFSVEKTAFVFSGLCLISDERMSNAWSFSLLNNQPMSNQGWAPATFAQTAGGELLLGLSLTQSGSSHEVQKAKMIQQALEPLWRTKTPSGFGW